jgi:SepF-like predicted cell division protein (DUF552 family)
VLILPIEKTIEKFVSKIKKTYDIDISEIAQIFLKAVPLRDLNDLNSIKDEVRSGNILVVNVSSFARKNLGNMKRTVIDLTNFAESIGGDIARLGEERIVITPAYVRIWRGK